MKKSYLNRITLGVLCASALLISTINQTAFSAGPPAGEGHLTITRSPTLGSGTGISVLVDGQKVGTVQSGNRYNGPISAGKHTLSVRFEPVSGSDKPATIEINVVAGQTYSFSATIKSGAITLQKNR